MRATIKNQAAPEAEKPAPPKPSRQKGELLSMAVFFTAAVIVGVLVTLFINSDRSEEPVQTAQEQATEAALEDKYGEDWRSLGVTQWDHNTGVTVFYYAPDAWGGLAKARQTEILEELWADIKEYRGEQGDERENVSIMIHDEENVMQAAYSPEYGVIAY